MITATDSETTRRQNALAQQLNADPRISRLGKVRVFERWPGTGRTELIFEATLRGEFTHTHTHCLNADFRGFEPVYTWGVTMVTRRGGNKKYENAPVDAAGLLTPDGLAVVAKHVKNSTTKAKKLIPAFDDIQRKYAPAAAEVR